MTDRDRLIELFKKIEYTPFPDMTMKAKLVNQFTDYALNNIVDEILANGVIVPPCKVGDWLWVVRKDYVSECFRVDAFDDRNLVMFMQDNEHNLSLTYKGIKICRMSFDDFGKTAFLTKEEAEQALKEREG